MSFLGSPEHRAWLSHEKAELEALQRHEAAYFSRLFDLWLERYGQPTSYLEAALCDDWPLRCEMKPKPSTRLADDLDTTV